MPLPWNSYTFCLVRWCVGISYADIHVSFAEEKYSIEESTRYVNVCLELSGVFKPIRSGAWVNISTTDSTAVGKRLLQLTQTLWIYI